MPNDSICTNNNEKQSPMEQPARKFRKFGDICLTEKNERVLVCALCKCLSVTPAIFWKHQREEHQIKTYADAPKNPHYLEHEQSQGATKGKSNTTTTPARASQSTKTRSAHKTENGPLKPTKVVAAVTSTTSSVDETNHVVDAPILQQALKVSQRGGDAQECSSATTVDEQPNEAFNSNSNDDNFNEFISYCCPECGKRFPTDVLWKQHTAAEHNFFAKDQLNISLFKKRPDGTTIYKCDVCHVKLNNPSSAPMRRHKLTHMPYKSFRCRLCDTDIRHKTGIVQHMRTVHRKGRQKAFKCKLCDKSFYSELQYKKHHQQHVDAGDVKNDFNSAEFTADSMLPDLENQKNYVSDNYEPSEEGNYDASAFLETEMTEEGAQTDEEETCHQIFSADVKEEPPEEMSQADDGYEGLWQEDNDTEANVEQAEEAQDSVEADQPNDTQNNSNKKKEEVPKKVSANPFECEVCYRKFASKLMTAKHVRKHGKKMDCRRCGVKISSLTALRRHFNLNRCKATKD